MAFRVRSNLQSSRSRLRRHGFHWLFRKAHPHPNVSLLHYLPSRKYILTARNLGQKQYPRVRLPSSPYASILLNDFAVVVLNLILLY